MKAKAFGTWLASVRTSSFTLSEMGSDGTRFDLRNSLFRLPFSKDHTGCRVEDGVDGKQGQR